MYTYGFWPFSQSFGPMYVHMYDAGLSPFYSSFGPMFLGFAPLFVILAIWSIAIKGYALWHAARNGQKEWFIALLVINTVGILELVYLVWFCPGSRLSRSSGHSGSHTPTEKSSS